MAMETYFCQHCNRPFVSLGNAVRHGVACPRRAEKEAETLREKCAALSREVDGLRAEVAQRDTRIAQLEASCEERQKALEFAQEATRGSLAALAAPAIVNNNTYSLEFKSNVMAVLSEAAGEGGHAGPAEFMRRARARVAGLDRGEFLALKNSPEVQREIYDGLRAVFPAHVEELNNAGENGTNPWDLAA